MKQQQEGCCLLALPSLALTLFSIALMIHHRSMIVPMRKRFGVESLGLIGFLCLLLMAGWAMYTKDPFMWAYTLYWFLCAVLRRMEAYRLVRRGERIHGLSDGWPVWATRAPFVGYGAATALVEPLIVLGWCAALWWLSGRLGTPPGLALWLTPGPLTLVTVASLRGRIHSRRAEAILDARLEQEAVVRDYRAKWGNS